jgi:hypothetical protein
MVRQDKQGWGNRDPEGLLGRSAATTWQASWSRACDEFLDIV